MAKQQAMSATGDAFYYRPAVAIRPAEFFDDIP